MNKTCFHDLNLESGARMTEMFGYALPWEYRAGGRAEHMVTREKAGLVDLGYMAQFHVSGPEALKFFQALLTTDIGGLENGQIRYSAMCDDEGRMIDDCTIWKYADNDYMLVTGDEGDAEWIKKEAAGFKVEIHNDTFNIGALQLQGPLAHEIMRRFTGLDPKSIRYYSFKDIALDGHRVVVAKMSFTGSGGFEFHVANQDARWLWESLMKTGSGFGLLPVGQCALESLRQEGGFLLVGNDHDKTRNPLEAGIAQTVKFSKPEFKGRAALLKIARTGIQNRLVWLRVLSGAEPKPGDAITLEGLKVGGVTSGSYSPATNTGTALAYMRVANAFPGLTYQVNIDGAEHSATLSLAPLYDPTGEIRRR